MFIRVDATSTRERVHMSIRYYTQHIDAKVVICVEQERWLESPHIAWSERNASAVRMPRVFQVHSLVLHEGRADVHAAVAAVAV